MHSRIKEIRKAQGLTQQAFAEELKISKGNIVSYETGRRNPSDGIVSLICNKYGVSEEWLRDGIGEMFEPLDRDQEIAKIAAEMFGRDESEFRFQLQKLVSEMTEDEIVMLTKMAVKLSGNIDKNSLPE